MKTQTKDQKAGTKSFRFKNIGNRILFYPLLLLALLLLVPSVKAQQSEENKTDITKAKERQVTGYYLAIFFDYKKGKAGQAMNFIREHFLPADKKVGRKVVVFTPMTGAWDEIAFFPLPEGPEALAWEISPSDAKWNAALVELEGSQERVAELWNEFNKLVKKTKRMLVIRPKGW